MTLPLVALLLAAMAIAFLVGWFGACVLRRQREPEMSDDLRHAMERNQEASERLKALLHRFDTTT